MRETLFDYCKRTGELELLRQWNSERNGALTPETVSYGSKKKVWWRCGKGHEWQAEVTSRTSNHTGCPFCRGVMAWPGETDFATLWPELAAQWHPTRNGALTPSEVLPGSHRKVWWRCEKGHEWQAEVKTRVNGCGCPVCANRKLAEGENDLATLRPELAAQWHPTRNGGLTPGDLTAGTRRKVWWRCDKGHEWQASVLSRTSLGNGCPVCAGKQIIPGENDLASQFPQLAAQWHPDKNGALRPENVSPNSNRKVWWLCPLGHAWKATVTSRSREGAGCPFCAGRKVWPGFNDLETVEPKVAAQWHPTLNGQLTPRMVTAGSRRKIWWQCPEGHVWKAVVYSRAGKRKCGCPVCAGRISEARMKAYRHMVGEQQGKTER